MKLSITQKVLGILIILAACYVIGWVIFIVPHQLNTYDLTNQSYSAVTTNDTIFYIIRYLLILLLPLGLIVLLSAPFHVNNPTLNYNKSSVTQIICGVLIAILTLVFLKVGNPFELIWLDVINSPFQVNLYNVLYGSNKAVGWTAIVIFLLGLAVLGIGIAQLVKSRKT